MPDSSIVVRSYISQTIVCVIVLYKVCDILFLFFKYKLFYVFCTYVMPYIAAKCFSLDSLAHYNFDLSKSETQINPYIELSLIILSCYASLDT